MIEVPYFFYDIHDDSIGIEYNFVIVKNTRFLATHYYRHRLGDNRFPIWICNTARII